jgi:hypothetical protein
MASSAVVGDRCLQHCARRPAHQLRGLVARQPGHIREPGERFDSDRTAHCDRETTHFGLAELRTKRRKRLFEPFDRSTLPQRQACAFLRIGLERRSMVRCCASVRTTIRVIASTTMSSRGATSSGASSGSSDVAIVSGCAAASNAC